MRRMGLAALPAALGVGWTAVGKAGGRTLARMLRGENPATMPIVELAGRAAAFNDMAAQAIGLTVTPAARATAQEEENDAHSDDRTGVAAGDRGGG